MNTFPFYNIEEKQIIYDADKLLDGVKYQMLSHTANGYYIVIYDNDIRFFNQRGELID